MLRQGTTDRRITGKAGDIVADSARALNNDLVMEFLGRVVTDSGAAVAGISTALGDRLGLYTAMAGAGPLTSEQLAERTGLNERYVREWLAGQVAGQYVHYDADGATYLLPDEHAAVLADADAPTYAIGTFRMLEALYSTADALAEAFRTGEGVGWQQHSPELFEGVATFFRPGYDTSLVSEWLPALGGVVEKLESGASVADVGCGFGYLLGNHPGEEAMREIAEQSGLRSWKLATEGQINRIYAVRR